MYHGFWLKEGAPAECHVRPSGGEGASGCQFSGEHVRLQFVVVHTGEYPPMLGRYSIDRLAQNRFSSVHKVAVCLLQDIINRGSDSKDACPVSLVAK